MVSVGNIVWTVRFGTQERSPLCFFFPFGIELVCFWHVHRYVDVFEWLNCTDLPK